MSSNDCKKKVVKKVMDDFKNKKLKSRNGDVVTNNKQALAIGLSKAQKECATSKDAKVDIDTLLMKMTDEFADIDRKLTLNTVVELKKLVEYLKSKKNLKKITFYKTLLWDKVIYNGISGTKLKPEIWEEIRFIHDM